RARRAAARRVRCEPRSPSPPRAAPRRTPRAAARPRPPHRAPRPRRATACPRPPPPAACRLPPPTARTASAPSRLRPPAQATARSVPRRRRASWDCECRRWPQAAARGRERRRELATRDGVNRGALRGLRPSAAQRPFVLSRFGGRRYRGPHGRASGGGRVRARRLPADRRRARAVVGRAQGLPPGRLLALHGSLRARGSARAARVPDQRAARRSGGDLRAAVLGRASGAARGPPAALDSLLPDRRAAARHRPRGTPGADEPPDPAAPLAARPRLGGVAALRPHVARRLPLRARAAARPRLVAGGGDRLLLRPGLHRALPAAAARGRAHGPALAALGCRAARRRDRRRAARRAARLARAGAGDAGAPRGGLSAGRVQRDLRDRLLPRAAAAVAARARRPGGPARRRARLAGGRRAGGPGAPAVHRLPAELGDLR